MQLPCFILIVFEWRWKAAPVVIVEAIHCGQFFPATWQPQGNNKSTFSFFLSSSILLQSSMSINLSRRLNKSLLHFYNFHFWGCFVPEPGSAAKRFLIGTKRLIPFGQLFTLLCRIIMKEKESLCPSGLNGCTKVTGPWKITNITCNQGKKGWSSLFGRTINCSIFNLGWCQVFLVSNPVWPHNQCLASRAHVVGFSDTLTLWCTAHSAQCALCTLQCIQCS